MADWYYAQGGQQYGPISHQNLSDLIAQGSVQPGDMVWREGMSNWLAVNAVPELAASVPQQSYAPQQTYTPQPTYAQPVGYYSPQAGRAGGAPPPNYLVQAILVTLCCCLPFGIVSIVYAAQVNGLYNQGNYAGAVEKSESAKKWAWIGFIVGLIVNLISVAVQVFVAMAEQNGGRY